MLTASLADSLRETYSHPDELAEMTSCVTVLVRQRLARAAVEARRLFRCPACATDLPREAFGVNASRPHGVETYCRACRSKARADRIARAAKDNPDAAATSPTPKDPR